MHKSNIKPHQLVLRCYAEKKGDQWQAFCLEFDLAAQAESFPEVKKRLESQIGTYVIDALVGEDREYAHQLLNRRAPLSKWVKFYFYRAITPILAVSRASKTHKPFCEPVPLVPAYA